MNQSLVKIGKIKDAHGMKGQLYLLSFSKSFDWFQLGMDLYLEGIENPFVVNYFKTFKDGAIIEIESVKDRNQSEALKGKLVYISQENVISKTGETIFLSEIKDFRIVNSLGDFLGNVTSFSTNGVQDLLVVDKEGSTYEVPFIDAFIKEIQFTEKTLIMDFPEDLININLK